jgi:hypothetical protein
MVSGPIPPYSNPPIEPQFYQPSRFVISAVALGVMTTITTTISNNFVIGQECRLLIPETFGCTQLNGASGFVMTILSPTQFVLNIDSSKNTNPFVASSATTVAQVTAIGDVNQGYISNTGVNIPSVTIPGAFINISPL